MSWLNSGLTVEFPSRGFYDEDNSDEEQESMRSYYLKLDEKADQTKLLVVTTTNLAAQFVKVYLSPQNIDGDNHAQVGHIVQKEIPKDTRSNPSNGHARLSKDKKEDSVVAKLFRLSKDVLHCQVVTGISSDNSNEFTSVLFGFNNCGKSNENCAVIVLSSDRLVNYQGYEECDNESPIQRCLISPTSPQCFEEPCRRLEQPNVIGGVAAAILTDRTFAGKPCLLVINYTDSENPDSITLGGFSSFFNVPLVKQLLSSVPCANSSERLKKLHSGPVLSGSIFM